MDYIYPALKDTIFQRLDQIIEKPNEDEGDNRTYFKIDLEGIYEKINNIYNKYNQILINISTNIFSEIPMVNFIIDNKILTKRDIEKLYLHGLNRIYSQMGERIEDLYKAAPEYKNNNNYCKSFKSHCKFCLLS